MTRTFNIFSSLALTVFIAACGSTKEAPKTPANLRTESSTEIVRQFGSNATYSTAFMKELRDRNFYEPDNCLQVVNLRNQNGLLVAQVLEMSAVPCPVNKLVDYNNVIYQIEMSSSGGSSDITLKTQEWGINFSIGKVLRGSNGYEVQSLCTGTYTNDTCDLEVKNSLFSGLFLY